MDGTGRKCNIKSRLGVCWYPAGGSLPRCTEETPRRKSHSHEQEHRDKGYSRKSWWFSFGFAFLRNIVEDWFYPTMTSISFEGNEKTIIRMKTRRYWTGYQLDNCMRVLENNKVIFDDLYIPFIYHAFFEVEIVATNKTMGKPHFLTTSHDY